MGDYGGHHHRIGWYDSVYHHIPFYLDNQKCGDLYRVQVEHNNPAASGRVRKDHREGCCEQACSGRHEILRAFWRTKWKIGQNLCQMRLAGLILDAVPHHMIAHISGHF